MIRKQKKHWNDEVKMLETKKRDIKQ